MKHYINPLTNPTTHKSAFYLSPLTSLVLAYEDEKTKLQIYYCLKSVHVKTKHAPVTTAVDFNFDLLFIGAKGLSLALHTDNIPVNSFFKYGTACHR